MVSVDAVIVDWIGQCYNDSLHYYESAKKVGTAKVFEYWRNCISSILMSALCMEAFLHEMIKWNISEIEPGLVSDFLQSRMGFENKLEFIEISLGLNLDKSDQAWTEIKNTISLRNDIAHFTRNTIFDDVKLVNAEKGIQAARDLIKKFYNAKGENYQPRWSFIDDIHSQNFDN